MCRSGAIARNSKQDAPGVLIERRIRHPGLKLKQPFVALKSRILKEDTNKSVGFRSVIFGEEMASEIKVFASFDVL